MKLYQLQRILEHRRKVAKIFEDAEKVGVIDINGPLFNTVWHAIEAVTTVVDPDGWIDWYIYENDYGNGGMKVSVDGRELRVESTKDLYELMKDGGKP